MKVFLVFAILSSVLFAACGSESHQENSPSKGGDSAVPPSAPAADGGALVGNGSGLIEQDIIYAYQSVPKAIDDCLAFANICSLNEGERALLRKIADIARFYAVTDDFIQFKSESENPGFFHTGLGQAHRLSKTGDRPGSPVFWNRDQFYAVNGSRGLEFPQIVASWIHEIGHQAGEANHELLDRIGGQIRRAVTERVSQIAYPKSEFNGTPLKLSLKRVNYDGAFAEADLFIDDSEWVIPLAPFIDKSTLCSRPGDKALGWVVTNAFWRGAKAESMNMLKVNFNVWLKVRCAQREVMNEEDWDLSFQFVMGKTNFGYRNLTTRLESKESF